MAEHAKAKLKATYTAIGLNDTQASVILLNRLSYGVLPGQAVKVAENGLSNWLNQQIVADFTEEELQERLANYSILSLSDEEIIHRYPSGSQLSAHLRRFYPGVLPSRDEPIMDFDAVSAKRDQFAKNLGFESQRVLQEQLVNQKIIRASYAQNQLQEVLTDCWLNHFFSSAASFNSQNWLPTYERDALRPHALGKFRDLLGAAMKHPALLNFYRGYEDPMQVDNSRTTLGHYLASQRKESNNSKTFQELAAAVRSEIAQVEYEEDLILQREFWPQRGPNQELARALVSLHTLGPDHTLSAADIDTIASIFTGWTEIPVGATDQWFKNGFNRAYETGYVRENSFLFRADWHDATAKQVMGETFPAGGGLEEGERLLDMLAAHPSTARHIAHQLAERFVSETPSADLLDSLTEIYLNSEGHIASMIQMLVSHEDFWQNASMRSKVKSPLGFTVSAMRAVNANIDQAETLVSWMSRMGQPLYTYQEPSGHPVSSGYWLDAAGLLTRMNFVQALANNQLPGIEVNESHNTTISQQEILALAGPAFQVY